MSLSKILIKSIVAGYTAVLLFGGSVSANELDDASVFVEAFNAFQKKDYLLATDKANQLNQVFPDSPLRDVTLLLIARSAVKSGDNELAARATVKFRGEFADSLLVSTIEEELLGLGARLQKGELLQPNRQLQAAALKVREERLVLERAAALKLEQEKIAREKAERERVAKEKAEAERRERERLAAEKLAKDNIKVTISVPEGGVPVASGQNGSIPVEISNRSKSSEEFLLEILAGAEFGVSLTSAGKQDDAAVKRVRLAAGETFKGRILLRMPPDKVDGHRTTLSIKAVSSKYSDVIHVKNALVVASAPLVRAVARLSKPMVSPGEYLRYRVTLLNIGTLLAQDLTVRVQLPPELDFAGVPDTKFRQEQNGTLVFRVERIDTGKISDISFDVKVRESSHIGQELRGQVEVVNGQLQRKDIFTANVSVVQIKESK